MTDPSTLTATPIRPSDEAARQSALFGFLLAHGILTTPNVSGALSTPMTEAEVEEFGAVLEAGLRAVA